MEFLEGFSEKIFAAFGSEDSIAFLTFILGFFLLGFLIAALLYGSRARRFRKELDRLKKNYGDLQIEHERLQEQIDLKQADLIRAEREAEEATMLARNVEREKENLNVEIATLTDENAKLIQLTQTYANNIEPLNNQILGLKTRNNQLAVSAEQEGEAMNQLMEMQSSYNATVSRLATLETKFDGFVSENNALRTELKSVKSNTGGISLEDLESRINILSKENADLHEALEGVKTSSQPLPLTDLEDKINKIMDDNVALHKELAGVKSSTEALSFAAVDTTKSTEMNDKEGEVAIADEPIVVDKSATIETAKLAVKNALGGKTTKRP